MDKRSIQDLTIKDNFMFAAVMQDADNCRRFLEMTLGFSIEKVIVDAEKSIIYHPEYRSVRLDVYAKDGHNTRYNVECRCFQALIFQSAAVNYAQHNAIKPSGFIANLSGEIKYSLRSCLISFG